MSYIPTQNQNYIYFYLWVPFLIIPSAVITTEVAFVLSFHIFVTSISRSLHLVNLSNSFSEIFLSAGTVTSNMVHARFLKSLIILSQRFASILFIRVNSNVNSNIVPAHFFLLLLVLVCICSIF